MRCSSLLLLLWACGPPPEPSLELGTGTGTFRQLADGDELALVYGPQGGWHVDVAIRTVGLDADATLLEYAARDEASVVSFPAEMQLADNLVVPTADGWDRLGDRVVFDIGADTDVVGRTLELTVEVEQDGVRLTDARTVVVRP